MQKLTFHMLANAHLDPVWLWDWREGFNEGLTTCRAVLDIMDSDPDVTFNRGEAAIYEHIEKSDPALFERITKYVRNGRWDVVGGTLIQSDENLPDTETLLRRYLRGQSYFTSRFGKPVEVGWSADCFGHSAGLPEDSRGRRHQIFHLHPAVFQRTPSAQPRLLVGRTGRITHPDLPPLSRLVLHRTRRAQRPAEQDARASENGSLRNVGILYGVGNHGGGPTRRQLADLKQWAGEHPDVQIVHSTFHRFFHELHEEVNALGPDKPFVHQDELNASERGCYSAMAKLKFLYRNTQAKLMRRECRFDRVVEAGQKAGRLLGRLGVDAVQQLSRHPAGHLLGARSRRADGPVVVGTAYGSRARVRCDQRPGDADRHARRPAPGPDLPTGTPFVVFNPHPTEYAGFAELETNLDWRPIWKYVNRVDDVPMRRALVPMASPAAFNRSRPRLFPITKCLGANACWSR